MFTACILLDTACKKQEINVLLSIYVVIIIIIKIIIIIEIIIIKIIMQWNERVKLTWVTFQFWYRDKDS